MAVLLNAILQLESQEEGRVRRWKRFSWYDIRRMEYQTGNRRDGCRGAAVEV